MLDPDEQARDVVRLIFDKFDELGTVSALLRYLVRHGIRLAGPAPLRAPQGRAGVAASQPDDAELPPAPPDLRRRLQPRPAADRPPAQGPRAARHRPRGRPDGAVGGPDPRPPARLHHLGAIRGEPAAAGAESHPRGRDGGGPRRGLAAGRAGGLRAVRAADAGGVHQQGAPRSATPASAARWTTPSRGARAWRAGPWTSWWPGRCCRRWSRRRWS